MTRKQTAMTITDLEARLAEGQDVTAEEWAAAKAADELAAATAAADSELAERRNEIQRQADIDALLARFDEPWDSAHDVLVARQALKAPIADFAEKVKAMKAEWDETGWKLRRLDPGVKTISSAGERWGVTTPTRYISGFDRHLLAALVAELVLEHFGPYEQPQELRTLVGMNAEGRIEMLEKLAGSYQRIADDWRAAHPGEALPAHLAELPDVA